ncbi:MAG: polysaccharide deacetylase family protein [Candidatus Nanopelagicales bacterium]
MSQRRHLSVVGAAVAIVILTACTAAVGGDGGVADPSVSQGSTSSAPTPYGETDLPTDEPSEAPVSPSDPNAPVGTKKKIKRTFQIKTKDPVFFITIDDGNTKSPAALDYVKKRKIPATVFLTNASVAGQWDYFRQFASQGGSIENHTMNHKSLTSASTPLVYEICRPQEIFGQEFGRVPTMLRPPYGNGGYATTSPARRKEIDAVASGCGIQHIVMWNGLAENGKFKFIRGALSKGDIVLFHFTPTLPGELKSVMAMAKRRGLRPAPLTEYLP